MKRYSIGLQYVMGVPVGTWLAIQVFWRANVRALEAVIERPPEHSNQSDAASVQASAATPISWPDWTIAVLLLGYMVMGRSFAHLGVWPVYVGEIALLSLLLYRFGTPVRSWFAALLHGGPLSGFAWCVFLSLGYGTFQCVRGIGAGHDAGVAVQNLVFHVYPLFFFPALWVGLRRPDLLPGVMRAVAWCHGIYGIGYMMLLPYFGISDELVVANGHTGWFSTPDSAVACLLGLLCFERRLSRAWIPFLLNACVLLGHQGRSEVLALVVCLSLWGYLVGRLRTVAKLAAALAALLVIGLATDISIPSPMTRGGVLSARSAVGKVVSPLDADLALKLTPDADRLHASTISWRTDWWRAIFRIVHETPSRMFFGPGYGYAIWQLHPDDDVRDRRLRTPHNVFMYTLGYTGWLGVALFAAMQLSLVLLLWGAYRVTGQPFGLCIWTLAMVRANFDMFFESPYFAIPFFLLGGLSVAQLLARASAYRRKA